jgi:hypothetical protein
MAASTARRAWFGARACFWLGWARQDNPHAPYSLSYAPNCRSPDSRLSSSHVAPPLDALTQIHAYDV